MKHIQPYTKYPKYMFEITNKNFQDNLYLLNIKELYFMIVVDKTLLFKLSKEMYNYIYALCNKTNIDYVWDLEIKKEFNLLLKTGVLYPSKNYIERKYIDSLCLIVCQICNMSCKYCFANEGNYNSSIPIMSREIAYCAIDKYLEHNKDNKELVKIEFFGGEPLLNWKLIKDVVYYTDKKNELYNLKIQYGLISNGTILTQEIADFIIKRNILFRISMDGYKYTHDKYRCLNNKNDSYDKIIENIGKTSLSPKDIEIVMTLVDVDTDLPMNITKLSEEGFNFFSINCFVSNPFLQKKGFASTSNIEETYTKQLASIRENVYKLSNTKDKIYVDFLSTLLPKFVHGLNEINNFNNIGCSAFKNSISIDTQGYVYPCDLYLYNSEYSIGNIKDLDFQQAQMHTLKSYLQETYCNTCGIRNLCKGICPYKELTQQVNMESFCKLNQQKIEECLVFYDQLMEGKSLYEEWSSIYDI